MPQSMIDPWIKLKKYLNRDDYNAINALQAVCIQHDRISLKLELDYKLEDAANSAQKTCIGNINELMAFDGDMLIGYIGICNFGGSSAPLEITGMVHPDYRRQGVFTALHALAMAECERRKAPEALGLCDRQAEGGQAFLKHFGGRLKCSEFEMILQNRTMKPTPEQLCGIHLRKATNADAGEVAKQNAIYFREGGEEESEEGGLLPEEEEKRCMTIYLAEKDGQIIGKINMEHVNGLGGIYGFGVLPEYRRKGFGRAILLQSVEKLLDAGAKKIKLQVSATNANALKLYLSCGFREMSVMDYYTLR